MEQSGIRHAVFAVAATRGLAMGEAQALRPEVYEHEDGSVYRGQWRGQNKHGLGTYRQVSLWGRGRSLPAKLCCLGTCRAYTMKCWCGRITRDAQAQAVLTTAAATKQGLLWSVTQRRAHQALRNKTNSNKSAGLIMPSGCCHLGQGWLRIERRGGQKHMISLDTPSHSAGTV